MKKICFDDFRDEYLTGAKVPEIAHNHGVSVSAIYMAIKASGEMKRRKWTLTDAAEQDRVDQRNEHLVYDCSNGSSARDLATKYGISQQHVSNILAARGVKTKTSEERYLKIFGCTKAELEMICGLNATILNSPILKAFSAQKRGATKRGIAFNFTLIEWWQEWKLSGKWHLRGRVKGAYVMGRKGDSGAYEVGNVYICTAAQNVKDAWEFHGKDAWIRRIKMEKLLR